MCAYSVVLSMCEKNIIEFIILYLKVALPVKILDMKKKYKYIKPHKLKKSLLVIIVDYSRIREVKEAK